MKKKVFIILILVIVIALGLLVLSGCENKDKTKENEVEKTENEEIQNIPVVADESLVKINDLEFHLDKESTFKDMKYVVVGDFKEANLDRYVQYNYYQEDNTNLLYFRIFYYEGKSVEEVINDLGIEGETIFTDGQTERLEYKLLEDPRDDGGTIHYYFINKDDSIYVLNFVSKYDIKDFENKVVSTVKF